MTDIREQIAMLRGDRKDVLDVAFHAARSMKNMLAVVEAAQAVDRGFFSLKAGFVQVPVEPIAELKQALATLDGES